AFVPAGVYRLGNWPAPFGIVLVADRLSALMLLLTGLLALAVAIFALARWHRAGPYFHALSQFLLMGLNGAFLTGDLFNLFVFFELLLVASYGLVLHGSGITRVKAGLHYIVVNLVASLLFLVGVSLIYGVTGTLNMADLAHRIPLISADDRALFEAGAAVLGIAFLIKAGMWPLGFWLPTTYGAAAPPVAALFAIMSKVGLYVVLRLSLLLFGEGSGALAHWGHEWLLFGGMATITFGAIGVLASQDMRQLAGFSVLVSSGTVLAAIGIGGVGVIGGALFYLVSSTLAIAAFYLLIELAERGRQPGADVLAVTIEAYGGDSEEEPDEAEGGIVVPAVTAMLGLSFLACALLLSGSPPLSGFIAKFILLSSLLKSSGSATAAVVPVLSWTFLILVIVSGLMTLIGMIRAGMRVFWTPLDRAEPRVRVIEMMPVFFLLLGCTILTVQAGAVMHYMEMAARSLCTPQDYIHGVLTSSTEQQPRYERGGP
ncbi:MAG: monovalent cation/H+ antiporter subunit D, partial [Bradyrhizobium sp.]